MPHLRRKIALPFLLLGLVAGCGTGSPAAAPPSPAAAAPATAPAPAAPAPPPGTVALTGDLRSPGELTTASLARLPQRTVTVSYQTGKGPETRTETGVLLADALPADAFAEAPGKNPALSFAVLGVGADGYSAVVAYGEYAPEFGNRGTMIATSEDGKALQRPRLVVPGDRKGGRYVSDLVELKVVRVAR